LHNKLHNLHPSPNIIKAIKSEDEMGGTCSMYGGSEKYIKILNTKHEGKRPLDNIRMDLREIE
jgi:hypothetical protein